VDHLPEGLGEPLLVLHVPPKSLEEGINEIVPYLSFVVRGGFVLLEMIGKAGNQSLDRIQAHGSILPLWWKGRGMRDEG
jgi:hypothetical protein